MRQTHLQIISDYLYNPDGTTNLSIFQKYWKFHKEQPETYNWLYEETKFLMDKYNIKANKNLGQNFLVDENVIETAIEKSNINEDDLVIEIGPGLGTLTKYLLEDEMIPLDFEPIPISAVIPNLPFISDRV